MLLIMTVITGIAYPVLITALGQVFFSQQANGSLISSGGKTIGSALVGQKFTDYKYFWPRPSAIDYNPLPSGGSNLGPTSAELKDSIAARQTRLLAANGEPAPADLLCASASGLDPDISPEGARCQVTRLVRMRHLDQLQKRTLLELIEKNTETPSLGVFGQPRVNVLRLNLALDSLVKASQ